MLPLSSGQSKQGDTDVSLYRKDVKYVVSDIHREGKNTAWANGIEY
jgi:hypothetical protein